MTRTDPLPAPTGAAAPIANFSQCHVGIIGHLDALGELPALLVPAQRARALAADMLKFFDAVILEHHAERRFSGCLDGLETLGELVELRENVFFLQITVKHWLAA